MKRLLRLALPAMFLAAFVSAGCGGDSAQSTTDAVGSSSSAPAPPFEQMLAHIPDLPESRQSLVVSDIAKMRSELGIDAPSDESTPEQITEYLIEVITQAYETVGTQLTTNLGAGGGGTWLSGFTRISRDNNETTYDSLGFDARNVDQIASFGGREPMYREVLLGSFSPAKTSERLAACDECEPHEVVTHSGADYYAWGGDFKQRLDMRFAKPAYDNLGRGGRIYVTDGMASRTLSNEHMEQIVDASTDVQSSLADDPDYVLAARTLSKYDAATASFSSVASTVESSIRQMEEAWENGLRKVVTIEELEKQFSRAHLLLPYKVAAVGTAFPRSEGVPPNTYAVLVHSSEADATENADRLKQRIEEDEFLVGSNLPNVRQNIDEKPITWAENFTGYEVWTEDTLVILRLTTQTSWQILQWQPENPIIIHNLLVTE